MRECPSYPGYSITVDGHVFTHRKRFGLGKGNGGGVVIDPKYCREMKPYKGHGGYIYVSISLPQGQRSVGIHLLLLDAYVGPRPNGLETRHLDGNPENYSLANICYGTRKANASDRVRHGRQRGTEILTEAEVRKIRRLRANGATFVAIAKRYGISETCAAYAAKGKTYARVEFERTTPRANS